MWKSGVLSYQGKQLLGAGSSPKREVSESMGPGPLYSISVSQLGAYLDSARSQDGLLGHRLTSACHNVHDKWQRCFAPEGLARSRTKYFEPARLSLEHFSRHATSPAARRWLTRTSEHGRPQAAARWNSRLP